MFAFNLINQFAVLPLFLKHKGALWHRWLRTIDLFKVFYFILGKDFLHCVHSHTDSLIVVEAQVQRPATQTAGGTHFLPLGQMLMWPLRKWLFKKPQEWSALPEFWTQKHSYTQKHKVSVQLQLVCSAQWPTGSCCCPWLSEQYWRVIHY